MVQTEKEVSVQSSEKDDSVFNKVSSIRRAADTRKKSAEDTVKVRISYLLVSVLLVMWSVMRVFVNFCVLVITRF